MSGQDSNRPHHPKRNPELYHCTNMLGHFNVRFEAVMLVTVKVKCPMGCITVQSGTQVSNKTVLFGYFNVSDTWI